MTEPATRSSSARARRAPPRRRSSRPRGAPGPARSRRTGSRGRRSAASSSRRDALASLERLGVLARSSEALGRSGSDDGSVHLADAARSVPFRLPAPALGISRGVLDDSPRGARARTPAPTSGSARASSPIEGALRRRIPRAARRGRRRTRRGAGARVVVGAWGRWDALDRSSRPPLPRAGRATSAGAATSTADTSLPRRPRAPLPLPRRLLRALARRGRARSISRASSRRPCAGG